MTMVDSGLVRATNRGTFQRVPISTPALIEPVHIPKTEEIDMTSKANKSAAKATTVSAIDLLAGIAQKLREVTQELELAAMAIEEGNAKNADDVAKLHQLQALLKGLT